MRAFWVAAAALVIKTCLDLRGDAFIRQTVYTGPLSTMPANIDALAKEMIAEAAKGKQLTPSQLKDIVTGIYRIMSEGAVAQRNFEMEKTRKLISSVGLFLSWFMKQKGMSYEQIQAKYEQVFSQDEQLGHMKIIESAARSNQDLLGKFFGTLTKPRSKL